jgi:hypothetical protein
MQRFWTHKNCMVIAPPAPNAFCWTWMWSIGRWSSWSNTARAGCRTCASNCSSATLRRRMILRSSSVSGRRQHAPEMGALRPRPPRRHAAGARRRVPGEHRQLAEGPGPAAASRSACWAASWRATPSSAGSRSRWSCGTWPAVGGVQRGRGGLTNGYDHPTRLGADRWVAMIGARHRVLAQGPARPLVVVMVGHGRDGGGD